MTTFAGNKFSPELTETHTKAMAVPTVFVILVITGYVSTSSKCQGVVVVGGPTETFPYEIGNLRKWYTFKINMQRTIFYTDTL